MYFAFTTITTVGYGDILGNSSLEKVICIFIMFIGVIFFTLGSGALASLLQNYDSQNAKLQEKIEILDRITKEYDLPVEVYSSLKKSLNSSFGQDVIETNKFLEELPYK